MSNDISDFMELFRDFEAKDDAAALAQAAKTAKEAVALVPLGVLLPTEIPGMTHGAVLADTEKKLRYRKGGSCLGCNRPVVARPRPLNANMARFLIRLVRRFEATGAWVRFEDIWNSQEGRDYNFLVLHGLAEFASAGEDEDKPHSGLWRPTALGIELAHRRAKLPHSTVLVFHNQVIGKAGPEWGIDDALSKKWSWAALMSGTP